MNNALDQIVYPGSNQYSAAELSAPGRITLDLHSTPLAQATDTAYIMFQIPDLKKQQDFLEDFGMISAKASDSALYMRGYGCAPYIYKAKKGKKAAFLGAGFTVESLEVLQQVSKATGIAIESIKGPGGGQRVRLTDPDGFLVDLVCDRTPAPQLDTRRSPLPTNLPTEKNRINKGQRTPIEPSAVERFGHYVLMVTDFETSWQWYRKHLGLLPTDVLCSINGTPLLAFSRLDRGSSPADHHTIVLTAGPEAGYMHSAYETIDQDAVGQGQQFLKSKGWNHFWGIGRHILGSQIFDYWHDPHGFEVEHYADGDVFDNKYPTQYHLMDRGGLWAWGNDVPKAMKPKPSLKAISTFLLGGPSKRKMLKELVKAMSFAPRPWLK